MSSQQFINTHSTLCRRYMMSSLLPTAALGGCGQINPPSSSCITVIGGVYAFFLCIEYKTKFYAVINMSLIAITAIISFVKSQI